MATLVLSVELNFSSGTGAMSTATLAENADVGVQAWGTDMDTAGVAGTADVLRFLAGQIESGILAVGADGLALTVTQSRP
jgi:hypothetical protein